MFDPEHYQYHDILASLKARLDRGGIAYAPSVFDGLFLATGAADFPRLVRGRWAEESEGKGRRGSSRSTPSKSA